MKYKRYQKYKPSGVEWIGEIPEHWKVNKLFVVLTKKDKKNDDGVVRKMLSVSQTLGIVEKEYDSEYKIRTQDESLSYRVVEPVDLVVNNMWIQYRGLGVSFINGIVSPAYHVYKIDSEKIVPKFLHFLVRSDLYVNEYRRYLKGIRPNSLQISTYDFTRLPLVLPSKKEQEQIFDFLQKELDKTDSIISKSELQINLLQEKKQMIIEQSITKGLDPTVTMKDSGIEWGREIPEHWKITPIKYILKMGNDGITIGPFGTSISGIDFSKESEFRIYGQKHAINGDFTTTPEYVDEQKFLELRKYEIFPNDIIVSRMGTIGKAVIVPKEIQPGIIHSHLIRIRVDSKKIVEEFLKFLINSAHYVQSHFDSISTGATMQGLNVSIIKSAKICLPPKEEQKQISKFLENEISYIDSIISKSKSQINLLHEKKQTIVTAAVTGKIDVRNGVAA